MSACRCLRTVTVEDGCKLLGLDPGSVLDVQQRAAGGDAEEYARGKHGAVRKVRSPGAEALESIPTAAFVPIEDGVE